MGTGSTEQLAIRSRGQAGGVANGAVGGFNGGMPMEPEQFEHPRYGAIHRAVLAGLLGSIGFRAEPHEYTGVHGMKFRIFPGSALFKAEPMWVVAGEIVQTGQRYARTVARIQPGWIEKAAGHLVQRVYSEPRWDAGSADVVADETVSLYNLVIIPKRVVPFGPIDPQSAREVFIREALVKGNYRAPASFLDHNRRLAGEVRTLEAKLRRHDLMASPERLAVFYAVRVPRDVYNGPRFEAWRRHAERANRRLLFMSRQDMLAEDAPAVLPEEYPDLLRVGELRLALQYHFDPDQRGDGVTVVIPLDLLYLLPEERFDWLVPGMLPEKVEALIRSLPKHLRTAFVPVPQTVAKVVASMPFGAGAMLVELAGQLGRLSGMPVAAGDFSSRELPEHLRMNFKVVDESGRPIAEGRDLATLRQRLAVQGQRILAEAAPREFSRDKVTRWDFGDWPEKVSVRRHGLTIYGYPALIDQGDSVSIRLLESPELARGSLAAGVRRLFELAMRQEIRALVDRLPGLGQMALYHTPLGPAGRLKADLSTAIAGRAFLGDQAMVTSQMEFELRLREGWNRLRPEADEVGRLAGKILEAHHQLALRLAGAAPAAWGSALADIRRQLAWLMPAGFLADTPWEWLRHYPRYLAGIIARLRKLADAGLTRDTTAGALVAPFVDRLMGMKLAPDAVAAEPELARYRWMVEEYRVFVFAQELKTVVPVSPKRLEKQWEAVLAARVK